jgi:hypothetical protein
MLLLATLHTNPDKHAVRSVYHPFVCSTYCLAPDQIGAISFGVPVLLRVARPGVCPQSVCTVARVDRRQVTNTDDGLRHASC